MKLQIKTLNQKSLFVDIEPTQTVYELKKELSLYPDIGVRPELQKLLYAGKILMNDDQLSVYNIDVKKFLVVMILKQPLIDQARPSTSAAKTEEAATPSKTESTDKTSNTCESAAAAKIADAKAELKAATTTPKVETTTSSASSSALTTDESLVSNIVSMGYPEDQVRLALAASYNNPERAIEYLIEGIPTTAATATATARTASNAGAAALYSSGDDDLTMSPFELFRSDPMFQNLRRAIQQHPELINDAIQHIGESNPSILSLINENQQEFLSMLIEASEDDDESDFEGEDDDNDDDDNI